ncbi:hypothetical protein [Nonomuraea deserti]|uniref:hypothetical protein n=1 Tax=Nonomuraea deserti TaxID=1848322 RepID=UPI001405266E|nr:hypothetical protein [Nonomuraea deserti]
MDFLMCLASRPSSVKRASAACVGTSPCQPDGRLAARSAGPSEAGATRKPSLSMGSRVLENEPT